MKLEEYLDKYHVSRSKFYKALGITSRTLYLILRGNETSVSLANKIFELTGGEVTQFDLQPKVPMARNRKRIIKPDVA